MTSNVRVISDVPQEKLQQVVKDLEYEVGKDNIRVSLQPEGKWKVEYVMGGNFPPNSGSAAFLKR
jgi:hypothetical protein